MLQPKDSYASRNVHVTLVSLFGVLMRVCAEDIRGRIPSLRAMHPPKEKKQAVNHESFAVFSLS